MKLKPTNGIPWGRILREHILDMILGAAIGIWLYEGFDIGLSAITDAIKGMGGLAAIGSFIAVIHRIYQKPK